MAARRPGARSTYAALDLGTNNCRLLIAEPAHFGFRVIDAFSRIVRLGEGLGLGNRLSEGAIDRTIEALRICRDKMAARRVGRARLVATEACRLAENGAAFIDRAREELGLDLEVVDRRTEAYLAVTGCASLADPRAQSVIVFDIGGGSTEIAWLDGPAHRPARRPCKRIRAWDSLPVGVVTLAERHGGVDVTPQIFEGMVEEVQRFSSISRSSPPPAERAPEFPPARHLRHGHDRRRHPSRAAALRPPPGRRHVDERTPTSPRCSTRLIDTPFDERAANPCIGNERADLVLAGCAILEAIRRAVPVRTAAHRRPRPARRHPDEPDARGQRLAARELAVTDKGGSGARDAEAAA